MPTLGALRRRARWALWVACTRFRLRRSGVELVVDVASPPTWDRPPAVELTRQTFSSPPREPSLRRLTIRLGHGVHLGRELVLEIRPDADNVLEMADGSWFTGTIRMALFDGHVSMGRQARFRSGTMMRVSGRLEVGARAGLHENGAIHCAHRVVIADDTLMAERVSILDSEHIHDGGDEWFMLQGVRVAETRFDKNVWVGTGVTVLAGAHVGANSLLAANAVVRAGEYPPSSLVAGAPARVIRSLRADDAGATE